MNDEEIVQAASHFALAGRPRILEEYRADSCIVTTKTAAEFFAAIGISASAIGVEAAIWNDPFLQAYLAGIPLGDINRSIRGAWSIGLGVDGIHVVLIVRGRESSWIFDPSLDQAARPEKGLPLEPMLVPIRPEAEIALRLGESWLTVPLETGGRILYRATRRQTHTASPNWGRRDAAFRRKVVGELIRTRGVPSS